VSNILDIMSIKGSEENTVPSTVSKPEQQEATENNTTTHVQVCHQNTVST